MDMTMNTSFSETTGEQFKTTKVALNSGRMIQDDVNSDWNLPVVEMPLAQAFPLLGEVREFRTRKCIFNHDMTRLFNVVSNKYQVIPHKQIIDAVAGSVQSLLGEGTEINMTVNSVAGGSRMRASFDLPILGEAEVKVGDPVRWRLSVLNSYDYVWPFEMRLELFRLICKNGSIAGKRIGSIAGKHFAAVLQGGLTERIQGVLASSDDMLEKIRDMTKQKVQYETAKKLLESRFPKKLTRTILVPETFPKNKWELYNELTAFSTHQTTTLNRRTDTDLVIADLFFDRPALWVSASA